MAGVEDYIKALDPGTQLILEVDHSTQYFEFQTNDRNAKNMDA